MDLKKEIEEFLPFESTKQIWRNNHSSEEFVKAVELGSLVGNPINRSRNCGCIEDLFIVLKLTIRNKDKIELKQKQMEAKFKMHNKMVWFPRKHINLTPDNITDELAIEYLKDFPSKITIFEEYPEDWNEPKKTRKKKTVKKEED